MFTEKKTILFITAKHIRLSTYVMEKPPKLIDTHELLIESTSVETVLTEIKKRVKAQKIQILVGDDYSYVLEVTLPIASSDVTKEKVKEKIQEIIPENLDETTWEYSIIHSNDAATRIQVFILTKRFIEAFSEPLKSSGIVIEHIEPVSFALQRLTLAESNPHIIVHNAETCEMVFVNGNSIWATEIIGSSSINEKLLEFLAFVKSALDIDVKHIIYSDHKGGESLQLTDQTIVIQQKKLDPMMGLALKGEKNGIQSAPPTNSTATSTVPSSSESASVATTPVQAQADDFFAEPLSIRQGRSNSFLKIFGISFLIAVAVSIAVGFFLWNKRASTTSDVTIPTPTVQTNNTQEPSPEPTKAEVDLGTLKVQILNGSGTVGEAGKVETLLKDKGFETIKTGNADSYDYKETSVQLKESLSKGIFTQIESILSTYQVVSGESLKETSDYDVIIIIGSSKKSDSE